MAYHIEHVVPDYFPNEQFVLQSFLNAGLPVNSILNALDSYICKTEQTNNKGYQQLLASDLPTYLSKTLSTSNNSKTSNDRKYSSRLNENADLAILDIHSDKKIFFEIEFRPNVEKDLIKFQIGHNCDTLFAAVLILALDRNTVNSSYTTMPIFDKIIKLIKELQPQYPLLILGISGEHI